MTREVGDLDKTNETMQCRLKEQEEKIECLQNSNGQLEETLVKERDNVAGLKSQCRNRKRCLEKTIDELADTTRLLNKTSDKLDKKTEEHYKLASAAEILKDKLSRAVDKHNIEKLQLIKNHTVVNTELDIQKYRNAELYKTVCEQKYQFQRQTEMLEKSNEQNEALKQFMAKEMIRANESIDKLRNDKLNIINEKEDTEKKWVECVKTFEPLGRENEQLKTQITESQFKLDTVIKNGDEKLKLLTEQMENVDEERKRLHVEITSMNQINAELEKQLSEAKKMHNAETENVHNLERKLNNVCRRLIKCSECSNKSTAGTCLFFHSYTKVMDELKSTGECSSFSKSEDSRTESSENISNFDKLILKCESIIHSFNK